MDKVLIVEDDLRIQRLLQTRLQKYKDKFEIVLANNGEEAIKVLEQRPISLVVTDLRMPKVDGLTLLAYANENYPQTPCIVMTAYATPEIKERLSKDTFRLLEKPFAIDELARAISQGLEPDGPRGSLKGISVASFLQLIEMEEKTCFLEIISDDGKKGIAYFKNGKLYDAVYCDLNGEAAAFELIAMDKASIRLKKLSDEKVTQRINTSLMNLIVDAMRRKDEARGAGGYN